MVVAVGGANQYTISTSDDGGYTWTDQSWASSEHASVSSVAFSNGVWIARGDNNDDWPMYRSTDGYDWQSIVTMQYGLQLLGTHNGWFISMRWGVVYRSQDGENWEEIHVLPEGIGHVSMAAEYWSGE